MYIVSICICLHTHIHTYIHTKYKIYNLHVIYIYICVCLCDKQDKSARTMFVHSYFVRRTCSNIYKKKY